MRLCVAAGRVCALLLRCAVLAVCRAFSAPVDLGASIITGLVGNPVHVLCKQRLGVRGVGFSQAACAPLLHFIERHGVVFDRRGQRVERSVDDHVERGCFNRALAGTDHFRDNARHPAPTPIEPHRSDAAASASDAEAHTARGEPYAGDKARLHLAGGLAEAEGMDLLTGMSRALEALHIDMNEDEKALYDWLVADLEYGCASSLSRVSMTHWSVRPPYTGCQSALRRTFACQGSPAHGTMCWRAVRGAGIRTTAGASSPATTP